MRRQAAPGLPGRLQESPQALCPPPGSSPLQPCRSESSAQRTQRGSRRAEAPWLGLSGGASHRPRLAPLSQLAVQAGRHAGRRKKARRSPARAVDGPTDEPAPRPSEPRIDVGDRWISRAQSCASSVDLSWASSTVAAGPREALETCGEPRHNPPLLHTEKGVFPRPWTAHKPPRSLELRLLEGPSIHLQSPPL